MKVYELDLYDERLMVLGETFDEALKQAKELIKEFTIVKEGYVPSRARIVSIIEKFEIGHPIRG